MALDDYLEPEVAVTAAVTAALFSPRGRQILRKGVVYGLAGVLVAADALTAVGRNLGQGLQRMGATAGQATKTAQAQGQAALSPDGQRQEAAQMKGEQEHPGGQ